MAVPAGPHREPLRPDGVIGSITQCAGCRAAVVARAGHLVAVGIDAEEDTPHDDGVLAEVTGPAERDSLACPPGGDALDRVLFSAEESTYKAWYRSPHGAHGARCRRPPVALRRVLAHRRPAWCTNAGEPGRTVISSADHR